MVRISAAELADFMGISIRALRKLDDEGTLVAMRTESGRRYYCTEHLQRAMEIVGGAQSKTFNVSFCKKGISSVYGKVFLPGKWLENMGITSEEPQVEVSFDGECISITKKAAEPPI